MTMLEFAGSHLVLRSPLARCGAGAMSLRSAAGRRRRARPPKWSRDVLDAFFDDAREKLAGERPATTSMRAHD